MRQEKLLSKNKLTQLMKDRSFTKSPYAFVPLKLGCDVHALLSGVMYILSGENVTAVYTMSRRR